MANTDSNGIIEDLIWSEIEQSSCAQDFLDFTRQFVAGPSQHWFKALDKAVSFFSPEDPECKSANSRYATAFERVQEFAAAASDTSEKAIALFNLGKMAANGFGTAASPQAAIAFYRQAIELGEIRSMVNSGSYFDGPDASEEDLAMADKLYNTALANGEPLGLVRQAERIADDDDPRRYELFMQAAEMGCPTAMHRIGVVYLTGAAGQSKDEQLALSWFQRAAKAGHAEASFFLGWFYEREKTKDLQLSIEWHRLGAAQGSRAAMRVLGINLLGGIGTPPDEDQGRLWLNRAAVMGDKYAQFRVGQSLFTAEDSANKPKGLAWFVMAADNGHEYSAWRVALAYRDGVCCDKDPVKSTRYCEIAARAGYPEAQGQLGLNYWTGTGVEKDFAQAYKWINLCALQGESRGLYLLGMMTDQGIGCQADPKEALRLYRQSAEKGEPDGIRQVGECYYYGHGVEKDLAEAVLWYRQAAAKGSAKAMTDLGYLLQEGEGVLTNYEEAAAWYTKAAELDEPRAMYFLALLHESGDGVQQSEDLCRRWMGRAAMLDYKPAKEWIEEHLPKAPQWLEQLVNPNE